MRHLAFWGKRANEIIKAPTLCRKKMYLCSTLQIKKWEILPISDSRLDIWDKKQDTKYTLKDQ